MRRALAILVVFAAVAGALVVAGAGGEAKGRTYTVVFDNAFGLTPGVDLRIGGVKAGSIDKLDVEKGTGRALITAKVTEPGFSAFRSDARCVIRPQSLIGEYYMDCQPGQKGEVLGKKAKIPVEQTETTIPPDLVQDILSRPYRERLALIFNEFGGALASNGPNLNDAIRRAIPALNETDRVLKLLADNRAELQSLTRASATVLSQLSDRRTEVSRFVREAGNAAEASADRRADLRETIRRFPGFLSELRPTLADLGTAAREQAPALADLRASSTDLVTFFNRLGPFAESSRPALRSLGRASVTGTGAARAARPTVAQLRGLTRNSPELAKNLAIVLEHLNDRKFATEKNPASPGGDGFTGLEAILQYPYVQSQAINIFDDRGYILKLLLLANECSQYTNAESAKANPGRTKRCAGILGPNQPGVTTPDPTANGAGTQARRSGGGGDDRGDQPGDDGSRSDAGPGRSGSGGAGGDAPQSGGSDGGAPAPSPTAAPDPLGDAIDDLVPDVPVPGVPGTKEQQGSPSSDRGLLDWLLGP
ncbi:MAG TPA: MlaD family protein [Solirubrobacteraceae bacterium]|jgi:virulence factor Mce-like protein